MSGNRYLADTNIFIYLLQKHPAIKPLIETDWSFSFITEIELLGKPGIKPEEIRTVKDVLNAAFKVNHSQAISEVAIGIKQQQTLKTPDAIIAATALVNGLPLITADKVFTKIRSIDIVLLDV